MLTLIYIGKLAKSIEGHSVDLASGVQHLFPGSGSWWDVVPMEALGISVGEDFHARLSKYAEYF
jgi:hypothetical protein